ncbi:MAG TPA: CoA-binding protein [Egibacteraceae bacterium]|nr:CoA-binding protein [Egibacteraceae bacterium]
MADIREILDLADTVAVVGMSSNPNKAAYSVPAGLQAAGFRIIPVNPTARTILGEQAYASLGEVPEEIDVVEVFRPADEAPGIVQQAAAVGAKAVWLQKGLTSPEARAAAEEAGLAYVEDACMGVERSRYGITKFDT